MRSWTQDEFVARRKGEWTALDSVLTAGKPLHKLPPGEISSFSALYRGVCGDLVHARDVGFTADLVAYLDGLAGRAHNLLYAAPPYRLRAAWDLVARDFPRAIRRNLKFFGLGLGLFYVPLAVCMVATLLNPDFATHILPHEALAGMAEMYSEAHTGRDAGTDAGMAGFYVYNNVGIAFRCFATGVLFGLGSLFFLVYNGLVIGTILGHVVAAGHGHNILTFVCTHGTFELTAIAIAGGAGLQMGYALVDTGGRTRLGSLRAHGRDLAVIIIGAALMLFIAAAIEGFWSPSGVPAPVKWVTSGVLAVLIALYFILAGRDTGHTPPAKRRVYAGSGGLEVVSPGGPATSLTSGRLAGVRP
jgi:uncharacterized membrane protein SpoIIM required for sporulation